MYTSIVSNILTSEKDSDFWTVVVRVRVNGRVLAAYEREHAKAYATKGQALTEFLDFLSGEIANIFEGAIENDC
jgi:hypothetical protein